jgi:uncharacterized repeat protein (TIGR03803 family)
VKKTSRSADGFGWLSIGLQVLGRKPLRKSRFGLVASLLLGGLGAAIFAPAAWAGSEVTLHSFTGGSDGGRPEDGLILDSAGNLYGTTPTAGNTSDCGGGGCGTVFKLSPVSGGGYAETLLYSFTDGNDGGYPYGGLILDNAGNLYGTTNNGGTSDAGTVFKLSPAAGGSYTETVLYSFTGVNGDGRQPTSALIFDNAGNLYGTTQYGGSSISSAGTVFKLSPASGGSYTETVLYSFTNGSDGGFSNAGVILDSAGNLYGTTENGGAFLKGTVFKLSPASGGSYTETVLHSFTEGSDGGGPFAGVILDSAGNLYGTTAYGGNLIDCGNFGCGTVFKLSPASGGAYTETVLHAFTSGADGWDVVGGLVFDSAGNLYGTTVEGGSTSYCNGYGCGTVFKLSPASGGSYTETVLYSFTNVTDGDSPYAGVVLDSVGNLYGTTIYGGASGPTGAGTAFEIVKALSVPSKYNFGNVARGDTSAVATLIVKVGSAAVSFSGTSLSGANSTDFSIIANTCTGTIAPTKDCTIALTFTPSASIGTVESATLSLADSAPGGSQTIALSGTSSAQITVTPTSDNFDDVAKGDTSANHTFTIANHQPSATSLSVAITGAGASNFAFNGGTCGGSLSAFHSCTVILNFTPSAAIGTVESAALSVADNATNNPQTIALSGTSSAQVVLIPTSVAFGTVAIGNTSANHTIIIENHQSSAISLSTSISGANSTDFGFKGGTCSSSLKPFVSCTVILDFTPGAPGNRSATLNLTDSPDSNSPHSVGLTGKGN